MSDENLIALKETVEYRYRRIMMVSLLTLLVLLPFGFAIYNFLNLQNCQNKPSNGCPSIYTYGPNNEAVQASLDPTTNKIIYNDK